MTATRPRLLGGAVVAILFALAPMPVAPGWTAVTWPLAALFLVLEIQLWISLPRKWRRSAGRTSEGATATAPAPTPETAAYLDRVDASLGLPTEVRAEIRAELSDHLDDSIEALEAEGLDRQRAIREALSRLGRAEELARQLRAAHQSTRRLLAGAAGGVWSAGVGVAQGYLVVFGLWMLSLDVGVVVLRKPFDDVMAYWRGDSLAAADLAPVTVMICIAAWVPAFLAGRRCVRASARLSQRKAGRLRLSWAAAGLAVLGWLVTFGIKIQQSWLVVPCELAVPILFAAGALMRADVDLHLPRARSRLALLPAALLVGGLLTGAAVPTHAQYGPGEVVFSTDPTASDLGYDRVGPAAPVSCPPGVDPSGSTYSCALVQPDDMMFDYSTRVSEDWAVIDPAGLAGYRDVRFEVWRGSVFTYTSDPPASIREPYWLFALDPAQATPFAIRPALGFGGYIHFDADLSHMRASRWLVFVTGIAGDGVRERLGWPYSLQTTFTGTAWDWFTASD